jgi:hypothetical protein
MFSLMFLVGFAIPEAWLFIAVVENWLEGLCIYCFFMLINDCVGGRDKVVEAFVAYRRDVIPSQLQCCLQHPKASYHSLRWRTLQLLFTRPILTLILAIMEFNHSAEANPRVVTLLSVLNLVFLIVGFTAVLQLYRYTHDLCTKIDVHSKIWCVKVFILLLAIEDNLAESIASGDGGAVHKGE